MRLSVDVHEQGLDRIYLSRGGMDRLLRCMSHNNYYVYPMGLGMPTSTSTPVKLIGSFLLLTYWGAWDSSNTASIFGLGVGVSAYT